MSNLPKPGRAREDVLADLHQCANMHSEAVVLFHSSIAANMGLDPTAYKTLFLLRRLGPLCASEISRETGLATASVTDLIDRLVTKGYVRRGQHATDRRRIVVTLIEDAITAARHRFGVPNPSAESLYEHYDVHQLEVISDFLRRNAVRMKQDLALAHPDTQKHSPSAD